MKGRLIVIEGTDCSGKETQSKLLVGYLNEKGINAIRFAFPDYNSPTGKIIAGPYLGKSGYLPPLFEEGSVNVDPYCACLLYAMDRKYNIQKIVDKLNEGYIVVLDRYVESNMAFQGARLDDDKREHLFDFIDKLEYQMLELPRPDQTLFLYMPSWATKKLKEKRAEAPDQNEKDEEYLLRAEKVYLQLAIKYGWTTVDCVEKDNILSPEKIANVIKEKINIK